MGIRIAVRNHEIKFQDVLNSEQTPGAKPFIFAMSEGTKRILEQVGGIGGAHLPCKEAA